MLRVSWPEYLFDPLQQLLSPSTNGDRPRSHRRLLRYEPKLQWFCNRFVTILLKARHGLINWRKDECSLLLGAFYEVLQTGVKRKKITSRSKWQLNQGPPEPSVLTTTPCHIHYSNQYFWSWKNSWIEIKTNIAHTKKYNKRETKIVIVPLITPYFKTAIKNVEKQAGH